MTDMKVARVPNTVAFSDGFLAMQTVWVVIRRKPNRFKMFFSRAEAQAAMNPGDELWSRHMYEDTQGGINNWSNFCREEPQ